MLSIQSIRDAIQARVQATLASAMRQGVANWGRRISRQNGRRLVVVVEEQQYPVPESVR